MSVSIFQFFQPALSKMKKGSLPTKKTQQKTAWKETNARKGGEEYGEVLKKEECGVYVRRRLGKKHSINATCENIPRKIHFFDDMFYS